MNYSTECLYKVWDNNHGVCIQIGEGEDGYGVAISTPDEKSIEFYGEFNLVLHDEEQAINFLQALETMISRQFPNKGEKK